MYKNRQQKNKFEESLESKLKDSEAAPTFGNHLIWMNPNTKATNEESKIQKSTKLNKLQAYINQHRYGLGFKPRKIMELTESNLKKWDASYQKGITL